MGIGPDCRQGPWGNLQSLTLPSISNTIWHNRSVEAATSPHCLPAWSPLLYLSIIHQAVWVIIPQPDMALSVPLTHRTSISLPHQAFSPEVPCWPTARGVEEDRETAGTCCLKAGVPREITASRVYGCGVVGAVASNPVDTLFPYRDGNHKGKTRKMIQPVDLMYSMYCLHMETWNSLHSLAPELAGSIKAAADGNVELMAAAASKRPTAIWHVETPCPTNTIYSFPTQQHSHLSGPSVGQPDYQSCRILQASIKCIAG